MGAVEIKISDNKIAVTTLSQWAVCPEPDTMAHLCHSSSITALADPALLIESDD